MPVQSERGYLITAQNSDSVDYVGCAIQLARSLRQFHPDARIALLTDSTDKSDAFDYHVAFTHPLSDILTLMIGKCLAPAHLDRLSNLKQT